LIGWNWEILHAGQPPFHLQPDPSRSRWILQVAVELKNFGILGKWMPEDGFQTVVKEFG
jgi:hypothetical protein